MTRTTQWVDPIARIIYASLQALFWFYAIRIIYPIIMAPLLPQSGIVWLLLVTWICILPVPYMSERQRTIWYLVSVSAGIIIGKIWIDDLISAIILVLGVTGFSIKKIIAGIGTNEIVTLFMKIMIFFGLSFALTYILRLEDTELTSFAYFFLVAFFITILGAAVTQLHFHEAQNDTQGIYKQWIKYVGWKFGTIGVLVVASIGVLIAIGAIYKLFSVILIAIVTPFAQLIPKISDFILMLFAKLEKDEQVIEEELERGTTESWIEEIQNAERNPLTELLWEIAMITVLVAIIGFIVYKIVQYIRKNRALAAALATAEKADQIKIEESLPQSKGWINTFFGWLYSSSETENKLRREYGRLLKFLHAKGVWTKNTFTVQQINQLYADLESPSKVYERLRYGDQELSNEEMEQAIADIKRIMREWK